MTWLGIEPRTPGPWANTLLIRPCEQISIRLIFLHILITNYLCLPKNLVIVFCDTMHSNSFLFVLAPLRWSLCLFWHKTHTKDWGRDLPRDWKWKREGRQREELTKQGRREQSAWDSCPENETVSRRRQWEDGGRTEKRVNRSQKGDC